MVCVLSIGPSDYFEFGFLTLNQLKTALLLETYNISFLVDNQISQFNLIFKFFIFYFLPSPTGRVKRALEDIDAAIKNEGKQKRNAIIDELKKNAAELTKKLETTRG